MAISLTNDSATISTTEYSLPTDSTSREPQTDDCVLQAWLDVSALEAGDEFMIRLYEKINGSAELIVEEWTLVGAQARPGWTMPTVIVGEGWDVTVTKIAGTDRSIGWSLRKIT